MKRAMDIVGLLALTWCGSLPAAAQEADPPCQHPDLNHAAFLEGEWRVSIRERTGPEGDDWLERSGTSVWSWRVADCVLLEELSLEGDQRRYSELRLLAYDQRAREWNLVVADSQHGNIVNMVGRAVPNGLVFIGAQTRRGQVLLDRVSLRRVRDGEFEWLVEASFDAGDTWMRLLVARYHRR